jgi:hypothetical protein
MSRKRGSQTRKGRPPEPCSICGRRRNLALYGGRCFACAGSGYHRPNNGRAPGVVLGPHGTPLQAYREGAGEQAVERSRRVMIYARQAAAGRTLDPNDLADPVWDR